MYSQASQITFICPMIFNYFPLDTQVSWNMLLYKMSSILLDFKTFNLFLNYYENHMNIFQTKRYLCMVHSPFAYLYFLSKNVKNSDFIVNSIVFGKVLWATFYRHFTFIIYPNINHFYNPTFIAGVQVSSRFLFIQHGKNDISCFSIRLCTYFQVGLM